MLRLMWSSSAISLLVRPRATVTRTCSSRPVSGSAGSAGGRPARRPANVASSRAVTLGAISASPLAAAWTAWTSRSGPASLSRKPRAPAFSAPWTYSSRSKVVITTIASGFSIVGPRELPRGRDAVQFRHPDVEQADVGSQPAGERHGGAPVGGLADDLDAGLGVEDHRQAGPDHFLIVGDQHPDHRPALGRVALTVQPSPGPGPASNVPPSSAARSVMPISP